MWLVGVGGIYGCGVRRYIDLLILLIPTPLVSVLFCSSIPTFVHFVKCFSFLLYRRKKKKNAKSRFLLLRAVCM